MSTTYHIGCNTCKEHMWIGQTGHIKGQDPDTFLYIYSGDQHTMNLLSSFLQKHAIQQAYENIYHDEDVPDHILVFGRSEIFWDCDGWKEINTDKYAKGAYVTEDDDAL